MAAYANYEPPQPTQHVTCSFCGKSSREVPVVLGPRVNICGGCVEACVEALATLPTGAYNKAPSFQEGDGI